MGAILDSHHPLRGMVAGAIGGAVSESVAEWTKPHLGHQWAGNAGLLSGPFAALLAGQDVDVASATASNAIVNDFANQDRFALEKLLEFAAENASELAAYKMLEAGGAPAQVAAILNDPIFQSLTEEAQYISRNGVMTTRLPDLPGMERSEFTTPHAQHHQLVDLFLDASAYVSRIAEHNPFMAKLAVTGLQGALMGPVKMVQGMAQDYFLGETISNLKDTATRFVSDKLMIEPQHVELAGSAAYMGLSFVFSGATKVVDVAQDVQRSVGRVERRIHKNSLEYVGDTHVYIIRNAENNIIQKYGESALGKNKFGQSIRAQAQVRELQKTTGEKYYSEIIKEFPNKRSARIGETKYIKTHRKVFGKDSLPLNKTNR